MKRLSQGCLPSAPTQSLRQVRKESNCDIALLETSMQTCSPCGGDLNLCSVLLASKRRRRCAGGAGCCADCAGHRASRSDAGIGSGTLPCTASLRDRVSKRLQENNSQNGRGARI